MAENELLTPAEVAVMFRVNPKTVTRWARAGRISAIRTLGGHRRFRASEIRKVLEQVQEQRSESSLLATRVVDPPAPTGWTARKRRRLFVVLRDKWTQLERSCSPAVAVHAPGCRHCNDEGPALTLPPRSNQAGGFALPKEAAPVRAGTIRRSAGPPAVTVTSRTPGRPERAGGSVRDGSSGGRRRRRRRPRRSGRGGPHRSRR